MQTGPLTGILLVPGQRQTGKRGEEKETEIEENPRQSQTPPNTSCNVGALQNVIDRDDVENSERA